MLASAVLCFGRFCKGVCRLQSVESNGEVGFSDSKLGSEAAKVTRLTVPESDRVVTDICLLTNVENIKPPGFAVED